MHGWAMATAFAEPPTSMPLYRVDSREFEASEADIRAVCDSAGMTLWRQFHDYEIEPFVVTRGREGPILLFKRNDQKEIVLKLDTGKTFWSQYGYQFSHEFCHMLCGFREGDASNKWFEETLCETASLFTLREMARTWKEQPPYKHWSDYRDHLREYADNVIRNRKELAAIHRQGLPTFYRQHEAALRKKPTERELNGAMAVVLLHFFEEDPQRWEAIRWLNAELPPPDEPFSDYLARWQAAVPERHREVVEKIGALYGLEGLRP